MQIAPFHDHERKSVYDWEPFDYLHWLRNIQDSEEFMWNEKTARFAKMIADDLFERIKHDMEKRA